MVDNRNNLSNNIFPIWLVILLHIYTTPSHASDTKSVSVVALFFSKGISIEVPPPKNAWGIPRPKHKLLDIQTNPDKLEAVFEKSIEKSFESSRQFKIVSNQNLQLKKPGLRKQLLPARHYQRRKILQNYAYRHEESRLVISTGSIIGDIAVMAISEANKDSQKPKPFNSLSKPLMRVLSAAGKGKTDYILVVTPSSDLLLSGEHKLQPFGFGLLYHNSGNIEAYCAYNLALIDVSTEDVFVNYSTIGTKTLGLDKKSQPLTEEQRQDIIELVNVYIDSNTNKISLQDIPKDQSFSQNDIDSFKTRLKTDDTDKLDFLSELLPIAKHHSLEEYYNLPNPDQLDYIGKVENAVSASINNAVDSLMTIYTSESTKWDQDF